MGGADDRSPSWDSEVFVEGAQALRSAPHSRRRTESFVGSDRVVFNLGGNKYRLVVAVKYSAQLVFIVGTQAAYGDIDAGEV